MYIFFFNISSVIETLRLWWFHNLLTLWLISVFFFSNLHFDQWILDITKESCRVISLYIIQKKFKGTLCRIADLLWYQKVILGTIFHKSHSKLLSFLNNYTKNTEEPLIKACSSMTSENIGPLKTNPYSVSKNLKWRIPSPPFYWH